MNKDYQREQLRRMLENPMLQSGIYLIDTDLEDKDIEDFLKEQYSWSYLTAFLLPSKGSSTFEMFVIGLSYQCKSDDVRRQRDSYFDSELKDKETIVYSLSILVVRNLCPKGKTVLHVQGDNDLNSLDHEDLWKIKDSIKYHDGPVLVISKHKKSSNNVLDSNITLLSFKEKNKYWLMENKLSKVYISYKHDSAYEKAIEAIQAGLTKNKIAFSIDEKDLKYRDNIEEYEKEIGKAERVIMFVTPSYLKSIDCMFEMTLIFGNKNVKVRVFPVVDMGPIPRNGTGFKEIETYWQGEKDNKLDIMTGVGNTEFLQGEIVKINNILKLLNEFWDYIVHVNTGNYKLLTANDAALLMEELQKTRPIISASIDEAVVPSNDSEPAGYRKVEQNGEKSVYIENNKGNIIIS